MISDKEKKTFTVASSDDEGELSLGSHSETGSSDEEVSSVYSDEDDGSYNGVSSDEGEGGTATATTSKPEGGAPKSTTKPTATAAPQGLKLKISKKTAKKGGAKSPRASPQPSVARSRLSNWAQHKLNRTQPAGDEDNASECSSQDSDEGHGKGPRFVVWEQSTIKNVGSSSLKAVVGACTIVKQGKPIDASSFEAGEYLPQASDYSIVCVTQADDEADTYRAVHCSDTNTYAVLLASTYDNEAVRIIMAKATPVRKTLDICNFSLTPHASPDNPVLARYAEKFNTAGGGIIFSTRNAKTYITKIEAAAAKATTKRKADVDDESHPAKKPKPVGSTAVNAPAKTKGKRSKAKQQPQGDSVVEAVVTLPPAPDQTAAPLPAKDHQTTLATIAACIAAGHNSDIPAQQFSTFAQAASFFEQAYTAAVFVAGLPKHVSGILNNPRP
jgi:hypothetical protein